MIEIVTASAGTGKTWRLTELLAESVTTRSIPADRVMVTTFTVKAAQELLSRCRTRLWQAGRGEEAHLLGASMTGTLHSIGSRLLSGFAFSLGLSPRLDVIAEEDSLLCIQEALEDVWTEEPWRTRVHQAAAAFGIESVEWQATVREILTAARANALEPEAVVACGQQTVSELLGFLEAPEDRPHDEQLQAAVDAAMSILGTPTTKVEQMAKDILSDTQLGLVQRRLRWSQWAKVSKVEGGRRWDRYLETVRLRARAYMRHPRLRAQVEEFTLGLHRFAAQGLALYRSYKAVAGLVDYGDQEERLLELLDTAECREQIAEQVRLLLVDEFQDTSPMQLAIFLRMSRLAERTIWVGDPKQAIYQFRGADPELMAACLTELEPASVLDTSYRSRPELLTLVSNVFGPAFTSQGIDCPRLTANRRTVVGMPSALGIWAMETENREADWQAISLGIQQMLAHPESTMIEDPTTRCLRPVQPGDIAILCRRRDACRELAETLTSAGFTVAYRQPGILRTVEGRLAEAGIRLLLDPADTLAAATIAFFDRPTDMSADAWLEERIQRYRDRDESAAWASHPRVAAVRAARPRMANASPWEALEIALDALDLPRLCMAFPQGAQRQANLEALRGLATAYEERCRVLRWPASPAGLLEHLRRLHSEGRDDGLEATGAGAIRVLTYHGAKGLEWPVVVLTELDSEVQDSWRGVTVNNRGAFVMTDPLSDRHLRYWFSPFERQSARIPFLDALRASQVGVQLERRANQETLRLLYVGFTRARDHLVLAVRSKLGAFVPAPWLNQVMGLPRMTESETLDVHGVLASVLLLSPLTGGVPDAVDRRWFAVTHTKEEVGSASIGASAIESNTVYQVAEVVSLGDRLRVGLVEARDTLGTAVHGFLAVDTGKDADPVGRQAMASRLLEVYGHAGVLAVADLLTVSDRLHDFFRQRYPTAGWRKEWPVAYRDGEQEVWGQADLLLELPEGWIVVDYKSYEGPAAQVAVEFGGQLQAYGSAVAIATGRPVLALWVYQVFLGRMVRIDKQG